MGKLIFQSFQNIAQFFGPKTQIGTQVHKDFRTIKMNISDDKQGIRGHKSRDLFRPIAAQLT